MNCSTFKNRISDYIDGEAEPGLRGNMDMHVAQCPACAELMRDMVGVTDQLSRLPRLQPSAGFDFALRTRLSMETTRGARRWEWIRGAILPPLPRLVLVGAAAVLVAASALLLTEESLVKNPLQTADSGRPAAPVELTPVSVDRGALKRLSEEQSYTISDRHIRNAILPVRSGAIRRRPSVQRVAVRF